MKPMSQYLPHDLTRDSLYYDQLPSPPATADCLPISALSSTAELRHRNRLAAPWLVCAAMLALCILFLQASVAWAHSAPPVLTAVTPNPLTVGTVTVTIQGTGFQSTSLVYDSYAQQHDPVRAQLRDLDLDLRDHLPGDRIHQHLLCREFQWKL